jgi:lactate permease
MLAVLALLPSAVVVLVVLGLRGSGLIAAATALAATGLLWAAQVFSPFSLAQLGRAAADAGVLTALVAAMVVPGILFVEATRGRKSPEAIGALVAAIGLPKAQAAILIGVGIGVMVESLTGMGVSLLVTMPLLLGLLDKRAAIGVGLVGMSLMPWGALSISAHVGAGLSRIPVEHLQKYIAAVSGPVAFFLPLLCLLFVSARRTIDAVVAVAAGGVLVAGIGLGTAFLGVEVAGVAGGLAVIVLMAVLARSRTGLGAALAAPGLVPYWTLLAAVLAVKLAIGPLARAGFSPTLSTGRVSFMLLTSPGVALLAATLASEARRVDADLLRRVAARAWRPVVTVAIFMLGARLLVECGGIAALLAHVWGAGTTLTTFAVAGLGALGGFVTGSGVTSNALFMDFAVNALPAAKLPPWLLTEVKVLAALQNAAGGHIAMASLPVAAILLATLAPRERGDDGLVMRTALALAAWHLLVATAAALLLLSVPMPWLHRLW